MDFKSYEKKWQNYWEETRRFEVKNHEEGKKNAYVLIEFPYPSGKGLHTGHVRSYSAMDAVARKKRMQRRTARFLLNLCEREVMVRLRDGTIIKQQATIIIIDIMNGISIVAMKSDVGIEKRV